MSERHKTNHGTNNGDIACVLECKPYGRKFAAIRMVVLNLCIKNPTRGGKRSPAQ